MIVVHTFGYDFAEERMLAWSKHEITLKLNL